MVTPKLGLGSVQWGQSYGITNSNPPLSEEKLFKVLDDALRNRWTFIDTSPAYGNAEEKIGNFSLRNELKIISKFSSEAVYESLILSLKKLKVSSLYGFLAHTPSHLMEKESNRIWDTLMETKEKGLVKKVGVSIYSQEQIEQIVEKYPIEIIQVPLSIFDQRLIQSGILHRLKKQGIEIHARSLALQGLLLSAPKMNQDFFAPLAEKINQLHALALKYQTDIPTLIVKFLNQCSFIDLGIVGVSTIHELNDWKQAVSCADSLPPISFAELAFDDEKILNPALWPKG